MGCAVVRQRIQQLAMPCRQHGDAAAPCRQRRDPADEHEVCGGPVSATTPLGSEAELFQGPSLLHDRPGYSSRRGLEEPVESVALEVRHPTQPCEGEPAGLVLRQSEGLPTRVSEVGTPSGEARGWLVGGVEGQVRGGRPGRVGQGG
jgi:hypothetical protein